VANDGVALRGANAAKNNITGQEFGGGGGEGLVGYRLVTGKSGEKWAGSSAKKCGKGGSRWL